MRRVLILAPRRRDVASSKSKLQRKQTTTSDQTDGDPFLRPQQQHFQQQLARTCAAFWAGDVPRVDGRSPAQARLPRTQVPQELQPRRLHGERARASPERDEVVDTGAPQTVSALPPLLESESRETVIIVNFRWPRLAVLVLPRKPSNPSDFLGRQQPNLNLPCRVKKKRGGAHEPWRRSHPPTPRSAFFG